MGRTQISSNKQGEDVRSEATLPDAALLEGELAPAGTQAWPLSFGQQRLWLLEELEPGTALYNIPTAVRLKGALQVSALEKALNAIVSRHESLRTRFVCIDEHPMQIVDEQAALHFRLEDISLYDSSSMDERLRQLIRDEINRPFNLSTAPLIRAMLVRLRADEHVLVLSIHHIVADEWSVRILFRELGQAYQTISEGNTPEFPELPIQYADFAVWQRQEFTGTLLQQQLEYWKHVMAGAPPVLEFTTDRPRGAKPTFTGTVLSRNLGVELGNRVKELARREGATSFMVLLAAFQALVHRYTAQDDIVIAAPVAGRNRFETEGLIGFFVNTLPVRATVRGQTPFRELLKQARETTLAMYAHQDAPFEKLVEVLQPERSLTHLPFTRVMFLTQSGLMEQMTWGGLQLEFLHAETDTAKFDLTFGIQETTKGFIARAEYNSDLFDASTIERMLAHFGILLSGALDEPGRKISELPLLGDREKSQILVEWNATARDYPRGSSLQTLFEQQVRRSPNAVAISYGQQCLTYRELNERANQLAHYLKQYGVGVDKPVGVCMKRSPELVVSMLAILKAGGAYVPLDPDYPPGRLAFMVEDTGAPVIVTQHALLQQMPTAAQVICLDTDWELIARGSRENPLSTSNGEDLAYIMYTSGSTGRPKGVAVPHRAVSRLVLNTNYIHLDHTDRVAHISNISFDAATFEVWGALLNGGRLVVIASETVLAASDFARVLEAEGITAMFVTTALFNQMATEVPGAFKGLRTLIFGGEICDSSSVRAVLANQPPERLLHAYGPTENATFTSCHRIKTIEVGAANVPIGQPVANTIVHILDAHLNPVPIGIPGQLYTGGDGLARGYWRRPELTAERFITNPFKDIDGSPVLYRTGDLARYLPNGDIEFLCRMDEQVKVRGFRIELGELENALRQHPGVRECVARVCGETAEKKKLVAYFVPATEPAPTVGNLRAFLRRELPDYMLPSVFVPLRSLPLTPNGKVDREALPRPDQHRPELTEGYVAPRDEVELKLAGVWESILGVRPVGIQDRFFDLGGHSLLAVRLIGQIDKVLGRKLKLATIFQAQTIEELAAILREEIKESSVTASTSIVQIQPRGEKPPLFLVHGAGGGMFWGYMNLSRHLGLDQPVYAFRSRALDGRAEFDRLEEMAAEYVRDLKTIQPRGPYYLGGYCFGGNVAFEMARQLDLQGDKVPILFLLNCAPPNSSYTKFRKDPAWCGRFARNLLYWGQYFGQWTKPQRREFFRWKYQRWTKRLTFRDGHAPDPGAVDVGDMVDLSSFSPEEKSAWETHIRALLQYHPSTYAGRVHLIRSPGHPMWCSFADDYGWGEHARGGVGITRVSGAHEKILEEPCVREVADAVERLLQAQEQRRREEPSKEFVIARNTEPNEAIALAGHSSDFLSAPCSATSQAAGVVENRVHESRPCNRDKVVNWWKEQLRGAPALIELPTDHSRPARQSRQAAQAVMQVGGQLTQALTALSANFGVALQDVLLSSVAVILHKYTRQDDLVMAIDTERPNVLPLRVKVDPDVAVSEFSNNSARWRADAISHSLLSFEELLSELQVHRDPSYHPICQARFSFRADVQPTATKPESAGFDLDFIAEASRATTTLKIVYATDLYEPGTVERMLGHWARTLENYCAAPRKRLGDLEILTAAEENLLLEQWAATALDYPRDKSLADLFAEQAAKTPSACALVCGDISLSYHELSRRAKLISEQLRARSVGHEDLVGICLERSWEMLAAILGTLQAGAAYVPMDPAYPKERLGFIVEDANLRVLVTQEKLLSTIPETSAQLLLVDQVDWMAEPSADMASPAKGRSLAYVIYTSGSTGKPKGVGLEHCNAAALVAWARTVFTAEELDGVLFSTSVCFDLSIFEMFVPLCCGGKVIIAENALALATLPARNEVRMINTVPSAIRELLRLNAVPEGILVINLAGEPLPTSLVDEIYSRTKVPKVYDLYGPTETTTYSTYTLRVPGKPATIGKPLANEQVYLLDSRRKLVPIGVPGELYIAGDGVTRGYLNRRELTSERFLENPFKPGSRMYKTGDLARWRSDGNLEFLGRLDHQVKVRGFRIELGEIEAALKKHPAIADAVVIAREDLPGQKRLAAYVVRGPRRSRENDSDGVESLAGPQRNGSTVSAEELRQALRKHLPEYMVPAAFVFLEALPQTPNGKIDRKALPVPEYDRGGARVEFVAPRSQTEEKLAEIWREVLGLKQVGVYDDFFDLGGNSLIAIQVISRMREQFEVAPPVSALFKASTIEALASAVDNAVWSGETNALPKLQAVDRHQPIPASFVQERLWFLDQLSPDSDAYNVPAAFELEGPLDVEVLSRALNTIVARHEALRTTFGFQEGVLTQFFQPSIEIAIQEQDLSSPAAASDEKVRAAANSFVQRPFDLAQGPLIRAALLRREQMRHVLIVVMHHTIADGWSLGILFRELRELYDSYAAGNAELVPAPLSIQYADFALWKREWMSGQILEKEVAFWKQKLAGAPAALELPADSHRPSGVSAGRAALLLPQALHQSMKALSQRCGITIFAQLMATLGVTLYRWTQQTDMVLGTVVAGRNRREIENLIGCFMNFLPVRLQVKAEDSLQDVLARAREAIVEAQTHQECPFERIVEALNPERKLNQNPLYNVALLLQNFPLDSFHTRELKGKAFPVELSSALLDLRFEAEEIQGSLRLTCEYRSSLFKPATIERLLAAFSETLQAELSVPATRVGELAPLLTKIDGGRDGKSDDVDTLAIAATFTAEPIGESLKYWLNELEAKANVQFAPYNQVFQQLLDPAALFARNKSGLNIILLRLEDWAHSTAENNGGSAQEQQHVEDNLKEFIAALKVAAAKHPVSCLIALCPCSPELANDPARLPFYTGLEQKLVGALSGISGVFVMSSAELGKLYPVRDYYDASGNELGHVPYTPLFFSALGTALVRKYHALRRSPYKVIVLDCDNTLWSGVCGEDGPSGIRLEEGFIALQRFVREQHESGMLLCVCSKNNEQDVREVFSQRLEMPLRHEHFAAWRTNWKPKSENLKSLARQLNLGLDSFIFVDDNPVEIAEVSANCPEVLALQLPENPAQFSSFLHHCWAFDHLKVTEEDRKRGEMYRQNLQREQLRGESATLADFISSLNLVTTIETMTPEQVVRVSQLTHRTNQFNFTTRRRAETELQRLPGSFEIVTVSVKDRFGDYGLTGVMVFEQRAAALDVDTFLLSCRVLGRGVEHRMLARLGELALERRLNWVDVHFQPSSKNQPAFDFLESIGSPFRQAQNGGFLFRFPAGFAAEVTFNPQVAEEQTGENGASAPTPAGEQRNSALRDAGLPASREQSQNRAGQRQFAFKKFVRCREIALNAIDAARIHEQIEASQKGRARSRAEYVAPRNDAERQLCELWQKLLHLDHVGVRDNFFELGGHSLLAVRLFAEVEKLTGRKLPLVTLFQSPTVRQLAKVLKEDPDAERPSLIVPLQPNGTRPPLFLIHGAGGDVLWGYANLAAHLPPDQPIFGIRSRGQTGREEYKTIREMAGCYLQEIRAFQPSGPYFIGGYCFGGNVAYEIARQLREQGQEVGLVLLLDSAPSNAGYEQPQWWSPAFLCRFVRNASYWVADFSALPFTEQRRWVARKLRALGRKFAARVGRDAFASVDLEDVIDTTHFPENELKLWQVHLDALVAHVDQPYSGRVLLLRTRGQPMFCSLKDDFCWGKLVRGSLEIERIPGSHENIFMEPNVRHLAQSLSNRLNDPCFAAQSAAVANGHSSESPNCKQT